MHKLQATIILCVAIFSADILVAQEEAAPDTKVLNEQQWEQLDQSVQRALAWLATKQNEYGLSLIHIRRCRRRG